ncbi:pilin [Acinetobacter lwoffii]|uniref:pilin n=1 Tax=Acinetobacter lwoffii TaxID=28090 RepID=UPI0023EDF135|nr:prepilin-type N-terminal cleavage/methylation domain-containing protein [Acinetobacter lwoffii]
MENGFTLIELMIVVTILGILSFIALPTYQTYIICSKIIEVLMVATIFKIAVTEASQLGLSDLPTTCKEFSCGTLAGGESHLVAILSTVMNGEILIEEQTI